MYAIENLKTRKLVGSADGQPDLFDSRDAAQRELDTFTEISGGELFHRVVDLAAYLDVQPDDLSKFEIRIGEAIGKRFTGAKEIRQ